MERFAIKIDTTVKSNLYNICRLCGIDHPKKVSIIDALTLLGIHEPNEDEPDLCKKIFVCVGIKVTKNDQMPQTVCQLCADKINDFFEYREMCSATNKQTRKLLGIPEPTQKSTASSTNNKKRKLNRNIELICDDEGESILGDTLTEMDDDKKDIISNIPYKEGTKSKLGKAGSSGIQRGKGRTVKSRQPAVLFESVKEEETEIKNEEIDESDLNISSIGGLKIRLQKPKKQKSVSFKGDTLPLLTPKEPNKRERKRDQAQKLEQKHDKKEKKRKTIATDFLSIPDQLAKKLKVELKSEAVCCSICNQDLDESFYNDHLITNHRPIVYAFGCPSCLEIFKTVGEQKDHHMWHKLSNTSYTCLTCNSTYDKLQTFTRHRSICPIINTESIQNYPCVKCGKEFITENLHDWHNCYMKNNGQCLRCLRRFVKKSTLFKHSVKCTAIRPEILPIELTDPIGTSMIPVECTLGTSIDSVIMPKKRSCKNKTSIPIEHLVKSEPEANIDDHIDIAPSGSNALTKKVQDICMEARIHLTPLTEVELNASKSKTDADNKSCETIPNAIDSSCPNETSDLPLRESVPEADDDNHSIPDMDGGMDGYDTDSSDESDKEDGSSTVPPEGSTEHNGGAKSDNITVPVVKTEPMDDCDDVILIEDEQPPPIVIGSEMTSPPKKKEKKAKHKHKKDKRPNVNISNFDLLGVRIKQEPIDHETDPFCCAHFDPNVRVKEEPIDHECVDPCNDINKLVTSKRKEKKSKHKSKKDKRCEVENPFSPIRIKQEPIDSTDLAITSPFVSTVVHTTITTIPVISSVTTGSKSLSTPLSINIKKEPTRPGYDEYDPNIALNIKKEITEESSHSPKQPSLRLKITKNHGTLNATIIQNAETSPSSSVPLTPAPSQEEEEEQRQQQSTSEEPTVINPVAAFVNPLAASASSNKRQKPKNLYKKPALLAQRIREEMLARMAREKAAGQQDCAVPCSSSTVLPVICQVSAADGTQIPIENTRELIPNVRIKVEKEDDYEQSNVNTEQEQSNNQSDDDERTVRSNENEQNGKIDDQNVIKDINPILSDAKTCEKESITTSQVSEDVDVEQKNESEDVKRASKSKSTSLSHAQLESSRTREEEEEENGDNDEEDEENNSENACTSSSKQQSPGSSNSIIETNSEERHLTIDQEREISKVLSSSVESVPNNDSPTNPNVNPSDSKSQLSIEYKQNQSADKSNNLTNIMANDIGFAQDFNNYGLNQSQQSGSNLDEFSFNPETIGSLQQNTPSIESNNYVPADNSFQEKNLPNNTNSLLNGLDELLRNTESNSEIPSTELPYIDQSKSIQNCADPLSNFPLDELIGTHHDNNKDDEPNNDSGLLDNYQQQQQHQIENNAIDNILNDITQHLEPIKQSENNVMDMEMHRAGDTLEDISDDSLGEMDSQSDDKQMDWELENKLLDESNNDRSIKKLN